MNEKQATLKDILGQTGGKLQYQEQIVEIGIKVLDFTVEEANVFRKNIGKLRVDALQVAIDRMKEKLGNEDGTRLLNILIQEGRYAKSKTYMESLRAIKMAALKEITKDTNGEFKYEYQMALALTHVAGLSFTATDRYLERSRNGENLSLKAYIRDSSGELREFPEIYEAIAEALPQDVNSLRAVPVSNVPFLV